MERHSPLEAVLRASGATILHEFGMTFASDFGSVAAEAALPAPGEVLELELAGAPVVLVRESPQEFLISVPPAVAAGVWDALHTAGEPLGVASVGREAHERFEIAAGLRGRRHDHSGW